MPMRSPSQNRRKFLTSAVIAGLAFVFSNTPAATAQHQESYSAESDKRTLIVRGRGLNDIHAIAANGFVKKLELEIRNSKVIVYGFATEIHFRNGVYELRYSVRIRKPKDTETPHTVIDMRGTVWHQKYQAKNGVTRLNREKIPAWQQKMRQTYHDVHFEVANAGDNDLWTEAVLAYGRK